VELTVDQVLEAMADNRRELAALVDALRREPLAPNERARRARRAWAAAMRAHYRLLDAFLTAREREQQIGAPRLPLDPSTLRAPERPGEVSEGARVVKTKRQAAA